MAITYTLNNSAGGKFALNGSTGLVTVAGALAQGTYTINVTAADSVTGWSSTKDFSIPVGPAVAVPAPTLSLSSAVTQAEGNSGTSAFTWTLTLNRDGSTASFPFTWAVTGSGANPADAADFGGTFPSGSGTFAPGETSKSIVVLVAGDTAVEPNDTFTLTVTASGLNTVTSTGTISNDDASVGPVAGDLIEFQIMDASALPNGGTIDGNGVIARMRFKGMAAGLAFDRTKGNMLVGRPGWSGSKVYSAVNVIDLVEFSSIHRRPYPNEASRIDQVVGSDVDIYVALSGPHGEVFAADQVMSVALDAGFYGTSRAITFTTAVNSSTRPYPRAIMSHLMTEPWQRIPSGGVRLEAIIDHWGARSGRTVAAVDFVLKAGGAESVASTNAMVASAKAAGPYQVPCFAANVVPTGLADGAGDLSLRTYPWVGNAVWDSFDIGEAWPTFNHPKNHPVQIDSAGNYAPAYAIVSGSGATVGTPAVSTSETLQSSYVEGTTPAYASEAAAIAAIVAFNSARGHADTAGGVILLPNGRMVGGFASSLASTAVGRGLLKFRPMTGATRLGTGYTSGLSSKNPPLRCIFENLEIRPGAAGANTHQVFDWGSSGSAATLIEASAPWIVVKGCVGTGSDDTTFTPISRAGMRYYWNNAFSKFGDDHLLSTSASAMGIVQIVGGDYDNVSGPINAPVIAGSRFRNQTIPTQTQGAAQPSFKGMMIWFNRLYTSGNGTVLSLGMDVANPIGVEGASIMCNLLTRTRAAGTAGVIGGGEAPIIQISSDYSTGTGADMASVQNVLLTHVSAVGARSNIAYQEAGSTRIYKQVAIRYCAFTQFNTKPDTTPVATGANGARTGTMALRYGAGIAGLVTGDLSANSAGGPGSGSWLGEVTFYKSENNVGFANMFANDTSLAGSNTINVDGDYHPAVKLRNRVPAGLNPIPFGLDGLPFMTDGTGAAGAYERTL